MACAIYRIQSIRVYASQLDTYQNNSDLVHQEDFAFFRCPPASQNAGGSGLSGSALPLPSLPFAIPGNAREGQLPR